MKSDFLTQVLTFLSGSGATVAFKWVWKRLFQTKKDLAELEGLSIDNAQAAASMWKELVQELRASLDRNDAQVVRLTKQCEFMQEELITVRQENDALRKKIIELESKRLY
jgi:peptidoglycan hydrolase CwlO-like protein